MRRRDASLRLAVVVAGAVALSMAGCGRWYVGPAERHDPDHGRPGAKTPWPNAPQPCSQCHTSEERRQWRRGVPTGRPSPTPTPTRTPTPEVKSSSGACEPYLLVGGAGLDLEIVHLPVPGAEPTDCRLVVSPIVEDESVSEVEAKPLTQGLYRLVWKGSGPSAVPHPIPVWTDPEPESPASSPVVLWAGPGEPPQIDFTVVPKAGNYVIVVPVPYPPAGGTRPRPPEPPAPPEEEEEPEEEVPIRVEVVDLRPTGNGQNHFELLIHGGSRQISVSETQAGNPSFDRVACASLPDSVRCEGEYREREAVGGTRPDQEFDVLCADGPPGPCLTVFFSPISE